MSRGRGVRKKFAVDHQAKNLEEFSPDILDEVKELFCKIVTYAKPPSGEWLIPDPNEALKYELQPDERLQALKESLNEVKNQLSDKNLEVWHRHTSFTNKAGKVISHVRSASNAEICTQAWCKFYEILGTFPLLPEHALRNGELNSVHLCEAPGAFIASLNHYLKSNSLHCDWTWVANTLNPYHEANDNGMMIMDDRLIANTLPWWFFGSDDTGDIMIQKHLLELQRFTKSMRSIDLVTADGSFDCQGNPDEQEAIVAPLHYCEAVSGLMLLSSGGSFVLKMFTLYEHSSVCLLYLLNCCFKTVHVFKPATSKAGNSEVYVVCVEYIGKEAVRPLLSKMIRNFGKDIANQALFPKHLIPDSFLKQHQECCAFFHRHQANTINENLHLFCCMNEEQTQRLNLLRDCAAEFYLQKFQVQYLHRSKWLSKNALPGCNLNSKLFGHRKQVGSFNERKELETLAWKDKVERGYYSAFIEEHVLGGFGNNCVLRGPASDAEFESWYVLVGQKLPKVRSSPFCEMDLLNYLNEAVEHTAVTRLEDASLAATVSKPCSACLVLTAELVMSEVSSLIQGQFAYIALERGGQCLVVGYPSFFSSTKQTNPLSMQFSEAPPCPVVDHMTLHDGDPKYQQDLLYCILCSLDKLQAGGSFVLPIFSSFTRFTAGLILALHQCFHFITFRCPTSSDALGTIAVLLCIGYQLPSDKLLVFLQQMHDLMLATLKPGSQQQVLQFVPMEILLKGTLPEFLWTMNTSITKHRLHLLFQSEKQSLMVTS
ncbi:Cap-specific mRNA (nucleoside-2'-O-)-methyltransferase 2 [Acipenser ruthenus]|uniref:Cap-specific mRNA (nucleoside-2'-O-)-methyltransferase 2 n=1 Tax=Acipenser ruthenus TaxID=7906 RepID=A0A444UEH5_ACIRT|nr:Cap-specific mRNA (nucleoside-2'-O-)-methyltransferase 2 [Acipenser ruthenus]